MEPDEMREEMKKILDSFSDDQVKSVLRLMELALGYKEVLGS